MLNSALDREEIAKMSREGGAFNVDSYERKENDFPMTHSFDTTEVPRFDRGRYDDFEETFVEKYAKPIRWTRNIILNSLVAGYFAWATYYFVKNKKYTEPNKSIWCDGYGMFMVLLTFTYTCLFYFKIVKRYFGRSISKSLRPIKRQIAMKFNSIRHLKFILVGVILLAFGIAVVVDSYKTPERLQSLLGIVILFGVGFAFSKHRSDINWRPVVCGAIFQFLLGLFCIRMEIGRSIFGCIGAKMAIFFDYAKLGASFVYGNDIVNVFKVFAFSVLPVIFFFSFIVSILYYYGAMQWTIKKLGWLLQSIIGTTLCESVTVAANIFIGMTESPLVIKPYIKYLTSSEIHVIMSSGFATVSGTVLAAYMNFGADASHLITSSVMAAPATLAFSKLIYPETEVSQTTSKTFAMEKGPENSVLDAASNGAFAAVVLIAGITANLIAFVSFVAFLNGIVGWLGILVGYDFLTIEWFFGKLFIPIAFIIGIPWQDCEKIGEIIATKTILNEFVAYQKLGIMKEQHVISMRSAAICTFAICGFANLSSLGLMIGNLGAMCPEKRSTFSALAVRALISGSIICFINASIAGLLMTEEIFTATHY